MRFSDYFDKVKKIAIEPYADVGLCEEPDILTDIIAGQLLIDIAERQELLSEPAVEKRMERLLTVLDREKQILQLRFVGGKTQMEVASMVGISQAQVSRLEKGALGSLRKQMSVDPM